MNGYRVFQKQGTVIRTQTEKWSKVIKGAGIKLE